MCIFQWLVWEETSRTRQGVRTSVNLPQQPAAQFLRVDAAAGPWLLQARCQVWLQYRG